ncbi:MAG: phosphoenolpyruvate--protein phosphotransferase [Burkholderiales bacterium]|jgi:phosphotransferase system enzyme I (PtsI)|nr:phosphoenolpyruvate--protein phosphotransferase [Burkholderiales bacterium]
MTASFSLHGIGVSHGIAIGRAFLVSHATLEVSHYEIPSDQAAAEVRRMERAVKEVRHELKALRAEMAAGERFEEIEAFIDVHETMLGDEILAGNVKTYIVEHCCNAEWALVQQMNLWVAQFEQFEDSYLRERKFDVMQIVERILKHLMGRPGTLPKVGDDSHMVLVAHDLSPADMMQFKHRHFVAFVTDLGGATSHTAIAARGLGVPAIAGTRHARQLLRDGEMVIVDGTRGAVIVNPDHAILSEYRKLQQIQESRQEALKTLKRRRPRTRDGVEVTLLANIETADDLDRVRESGAQGIGLFRSEFLYLDQDTLPDEDTQFKAYREVVEGMEGRPVTLRTLDLGADKMRGGIDSLARVAPNPAMGLRAIRLCFAEQPLFMTQLRAALRASAYGKIKLLVPMLSGGDEIHPLLAAVEEAKRKLDEEGVAFDRALEVGAMIEVPSAALALGPFLRQLDFLSIGTNDLTQYLMAVDRTDEAVSYLYNPTHPAMLRLLAHILKRARQFEMPISLCGEMADDPQMTWLLLGLGLREFSMPATGLLAVKERVLRADVGTLQKTVARIVRAEDPEKVKAMIEKLNRG